MEINLLARLLFIKMFDSLILDLYRNYEYHG